MNIGPPELLLLLLLALLLFGVGRVARIGGELGSAVANFRRGLNSKNDDKTLTDDNTPKV